eukprot:scaffold23274_cov42-Prasinocladus_malaysianus.AAC.1
MTRCKGISPVDSGRARQPGNVLPPRGCPGPAWLILLATSQDNCLYVVLLIAYTTLPAKTGRGWLQLLLPRQARLSQAERL